MDLFKKIKQMKNLNNLNLLLTGIHLPFDDLRYIVGQKSDSNKPEIIEGLSIKIKYFNFRIEFR